MVAGMAAGRPSTSAQGSTPSTRGTARHVGSGGGSRTSASRSQGLPFKIFLRHSKSQSRKVALTFKATASAAAQSEPLWPHSAAALGRIF